jgi:hypothetical protein
MRRSEGLSLFVGGFVGFGDEPEFAEGQACGDEAGSHEEDGEEGGEDGGFVEGGVFGMDEPGEGGAGDEDDADHAGDDGDEDIGAGESLVGAFELFYADVSGGVEAVSAVWAVAWVLESFEAVAAFGAEDIFVDDVHVGGPWEVGCGQGTEGRGWGLGSGVWSEGRVGEDY